MKRQRMIIIAISLVVVGLLVLVRIFTAEAPEKDYSVLAPVRVMTAVNDTLIRSWSFNGHLKPEANTTVIPKVSGKVLVVSVKEGDLVREGQVLVRIEDDIPRLQYEQAQAAFRAAQAQYQKANQAVRPEELASAKATVKQAEEDIAIAKNNLERSQNLYKAGTIARATFEDAENQVRSAETQLQNAKRQVNLMEEGARSEDITMALSQLEAQQSQLSLAELQFDFASVKAPITGRVAKVHTERGQFVGPGSPLVTIVSTNSIFALVTAPETIYGEFFGRTNDMNIVVNPVAYTKKDLFPARITRVSDIIDAQTRSFEMEMAVDNLSSMLKPGMFVRVYVSRPASKETIVIPSNAIVLRDGVPSVYLIDKKDSKTHVRQVAVTPGESSSGKVEILEGIMPGEIVVSEGNAFLEDLQEVLILNTEVGS